MTSNPPRALRLSASASQRHLAALLHPAVHLCCQPAPQQRLRGRCGPRQHQPELRHPAAQRAFATGRGPQHWLPQQKALAVPGSLEQPTGTVAPERKAARDDSVVAGGTVAGVVTLKTRLCASPPSAPPLGFTLLLLAPFSHGAALQAAIGLLSSANTKPPPHRQASNINVVVRAMGDVEPWRGAEQGVVSGAAVFLLLGIDRRLRHGETRSGLASRAGTRLRVQERAVPPQAQHGGRVGLLPSTAQRQPARPKTHDSSCSSCFCDASTTRDPHIPRERSLNRCLQMWHTAKSAAGKFKGQLEHQCIRAGRHTREKYTEGDGLDLSVSQR